MQFFKKWNPGLVWGFLFYLASHLPKKFKQHWFSMSNGYVRLRKRSVNFTVLQKVYAPPCFSLLGKEHTLQNQGGAQANEKGKRAKNIYHIFIYTVGLFTTSSSNGLIIFSVIGLRLMNGLGKIIWWSLRIKRRIVFLRQDNNLSKLRCVMLETLMLASGE